MPKATSEHSREPLPLPLPGERKAAAPDDAPRIRWTEDGQERSATWHSESGWAPPARVVLGDDRMTADAAYRLAKAGTGILWRGDFHNARQLCLLYTSPSPRDRQKSRMPSSA